MKPATKITRGARSVHRGSARPQGHDGSETLPRGSRDSSSFPLESRKATLLIIAGLSLLTIVAFWPVVGCGFCNFDDDFYITANPHVLGGLTGESVHWALTHKVENLYHPLPLLSFMLDISLFGLSPAAFHVENLLIHLLNVLLLFCLIRFMTGAIVRSAAVAVIFAVHPLRVESVAWVVERKDVLALFFGLATIFAYAWYALRPSWPRYLPILPLAALSLLSKPLLVTLPLILLLLDDWPLRRIRRRRGADEITPAAPTHSPRFAQRSVLMLVVEKLPLFALCAISVATTIPKLTAHLLHLSNVERSDEVRVHGERLAPRLVPPPDVFNTPAARAGNAVVSYVRYLYKMIDFRRLAAWYPEARWPAATVAAAAAMLLAITALCLIARRMPWLRIGWGWYLVSMLPVVGFIRVAMYSIADRYTYFPMIGILIAVVWSIPGRWMARPNVRAVAACAGGIVLLILCGATWLQAGYWFDSVTLWRHTLQVTDPNWKAQLEMGNALMGVGDFESARQNLLEARRLRPGSAVIHYNLAYADSRLNRPDEAIAEYQATLDYTPNATDALNNLGGLLAEKGDMSGALAMHERAVKLDPDDVDAQLNLGIDQLLVNQLNPAIEHLRRALALRPDNPTAYFHLGRALMSNGELDGAVAALSRGLELNLSDADLRDDLRAALRAARQKQRVSVGPKP